MYLIRSARWDDAAALRHRPQLWRRVRRFNLPVQLAVAAGEEAAEGAEDASTLALVSLAPCQSGSPDLLKAARVLAMASPPEEGAPARTPRVNPIVTLHAVDNLALSALAISLENHAYGLGLGGGAGQAWSALEVARECLVDGRASEVLVVAGDQEEPGGEVALAVALLFRDRPAVSHDGGRTWCLKALRRDPEPHQGVVPHAAAGLVALLDALADCAENHCTWRVPAAHGDGCDRVELAWEVA